FVPADGPERPAAPTPAMPPAVDRAEGEPVSTVVTPIDLSYTHSVSPEDARYLRALDEGKLVGQRCPGCHQVYILPRSSCPVDNHPTSLPYVTTTRPTTHPQGTYDHSIPLRFARPRCRRRRFRAIAASSPQLGHHQRGGDAGAAVRRRVRPDRTVEVPHRFL